MRRRLIEHLLSLVVVTAVAIGVVAALTAARHRAAATEQSRFAHFGELSFVDTGDPFERALLKDAVNIFFPGRRTRNDSLVAELLDKRQKEFGDRLQRGHLVARLDRAKIRELGLMYVKFVLIYAIVMALTYYGVQTIALWRFCARKSGATEHRLWLRLGRRFAVFVASFVLFCPAYVIAYSIRTGLRTDTALFMTVLGVISNGLLIMYANKFYAFLVAESRRGYVETAVVKNLSTSYTFSRHGGIRRREILKPVKKFDNHVLGHIFANARHQYLATIKEQSSFLITGLIIIEMALNIHGHLSYEMLRQMLYRNYDIVAAIMLLIFYTVKATEIVADFLVHRAAMKYENRA